MKALVISAAFPPMRAGEAEHALYLCRHLAASGISVHVLTGQEGEAQNADTFTVHPVMPCWGWRNLPRLIRVLQSVRPDAVLLIYTAWLYQFQPMITFAPVLVRRILGCPFVTQFEFVDGMRAGPPRYAKGLTYLARLVAGPKTHSFYGALLRGSRRILVLTNEYRDALAKDAPEVAAKSILVPPPPLLRIAPEEGGLTRQRQRADWGVGEDAFVLAFYGYVAPRKGLETLIPALAQVAKQRPQVRLVLIGGQLDEYDAFTEDLRRQVQELGVADNIIWTGQYPSDSEMPSQCLWASDAAVLPFDAGITVNRSSFAAVAAHGLPTITTRGETISSLFVDGENVLLCPPRDVEALAGAVEQVVASAELRARLRAGIRTLALEWFSWDYAVRQTRNALGFPGKETSAP